MSCVCCWLAENIVSIVSYVVVFVKAACAMRMDKDTHLSTYLVCAPCVVAFVSCENADKLPVSVSGFIEVSCALAWTRYTPRYMPSECPVCRGLCCMCEC